ncbi:mercuric reductase [marine bacterium AO1-C]|nr:mercuric reductase [marine bacterium AO1-C]
MKKYDSIIIGAGQAGPSLSAHLAAKGEKVAIIEGHKFGGTCVNYGCTPTKTLVASARAAHMARRGADFGVMISDNIQIDMKRVKARKDEQVNKSNKGVENWMKNTPNLDVYEAYAQFESAHTLKVGDEVLEADKIFINVGGYPRVLDHVKTARYLTNRTIMDLEEVPEHLIVIGGSYIGLEFGQMYRRFGSKVTIVEMGSRLVSREDEDVSLEIQNILENEGIDLRLEAECIQATMDGDDVLVDVECKEGDPQIRGSHVLIAIGRIPNTEKLGLEKAGVVMDERGFIKVDDHLRTSVPHIWALGDCNGKGGFTHTAYNDYEIVADNLAGGNRKVSDRILCYGLYVDPPLARVGITEKQARESGRKILKGYRPMTKVSRAREKGEDQGFMKVLVDADTEQILGATILGVGGDELIHSLLDVMYAEKPYTLISNAVHIHPTVSELIPTMLQGLKPLE